VQTAVFDILKKIQGDLTAFRSEAELCFQRLEDAMRKQRRDNAAMLIMARAVVGDFDERVTKVEDRSRRWKLGTAETTACSRFAVLRHS
jgi:hypothetical protein